MQSHKTSMTSRLRVRAMPLSPIERSRDEGMLLRRRRHRSEGRETQSRSVVIPLWTIAWSDDLGLGVSDLDSQDRTLVYLVNSLNDDIVSRAPSIEIQRLMDLIYWDSLRHFESEERMFIRNGYPHPDGHAALHAQIRAEFGRIVEEFHNGAYNEAWLEHGLLVRQILLEHLIQESKKFRAITTPGHRGLRRRA